jgi:hypothetical protein
MALKKAIVTFTNQFGESVTRNLPIRSVVFDYSEGFVEIIFAAYASVAARERGAIPEYIRQRISFDQTSQAEMGLVLAVSDALWTKIVDAPLITDYSETDRAGRQKATVKSLTELGAEIVDAT